MSNDCSGNCGSCGETCESRKTGIEREKPHELSKIGKIIGIVSGKGGVGKSSVTALLASAMRRRGKNVAVMDADVTGPSIPKALGITGKAEGGALGLYPLASQTGIRVMSINLLLENITDPVIWRGPVLGGAVKQFYTDVIWGDVDFMFIDMPPGTGDVPLTVFQSLPLDGIIIVTSPQQLVSMIVAKAVKMAEMMNIPVIGLIENMSEFICPDNGKAYKIFGESHIDEIAKTHKINVLAKLPIDPAVSAACDKGLIELYPAPAFDELAKRLDV